MYIIDNMVEGCKYTGFEHTGMIKGESNGPIS